MIDAVSITDQRVSEPGEIDEAVPVGIVPSQPGHFEAEHETDAGKCHFGGEAGEARSCDGAGAGEPEVLIDDDDTIFGPANLTSFRGERVLPIG